MIIGSLGVYFLLQPDLTEIHLFQIIPLLAGIFYAFSALSTRHYCSEESALGLTLGYLVAIGIIGAIVATIFWFYPSSHQNNPDMHNFLQGWRPINIRFLTWIAFQAVLTVLALALITRAYQIVDTSILAVYEYGFLIFAAFWGWVLWSTFLGLTEILGIILIMAAGIIIIIRSARTNS